MKERDGGVKFLDEPVAGEESDPELRVRVSDSAEVREEFVRVGDGERDPVVAQEVRKSRQLTALVVVRRAQGEVLVCGGDLRRLTHAGPDVHGRGGEGRRRSATS